MKITRPLLDEAVGRGLLGASQADALWSFLASREADVPGFRAAHILHYLGGAVAIGALSLFMTLAWDRYGSVPLLLLAIGYALLAIALTERFLRQPGQRIAAGITAALAVAQVPLGIWAAQHLMGLWPETSRYDGGYVDFHRYIDWRWIFMEAATLVAGFVALWRWRLPFTTMPMSVAGWYLTMDLAPLLFGGDAFHYWSTEGKWTSVVTGVLLMCIAFATDVRTRRQPDFGFWPWLAGIAAFWGGLTALDSHNEWSKLLYCFINLALIAKGAALQRRVLVVFGALGVAAYLGHLSYEVFRDSLLFPVALAALGIGVIFAGVHWQRHEQAIGGRLRALWPAPVRRWVERAVG